MAVSMDLPDDTSPFGSIHPRDKTDVAERLFLGARSIAYNETNVYWTGPICDKVQITHLNDELIVITIVYKEDSLTEHGIEIRVLNGQFRVIHYKIKT